MLADPCAGSGVPAAYGSGTRTRGLALHLGGNGRQVVTGHLPECKCRVVEGDRTRGSRYRLVVRGESTKPLGFLFEGMTMDLVAGNTVLTGNVIDQAHLHGLLQRIQELGLELVSIDPVDSRADHDQTSS